MDTQNWEQTVWVKKPTIKSANAEKVTLSKPVTNKKVVQVSKKFDENPEGFDLKTIDHDLSLQIQKARMNKLNAEGKSMTQKELAKQLNVLPNVIQDYESGKIIPDGNLISKMSSILGTRLTNKKK